MANPHFRAKAITLVATAKRESDDALALGHAGLRGRVREIALERVIKPFLLGGFEVGSGKITDSFGTESPEVDLVIFRRDILPPVMWSEREGLFPAEASLYAIEVKSQVNATELDDTIRKARALGTLRYQPGQHDQYGNAINHRLTPVIPVLFGFSSDLHEDGKSDLQRYQQRDAKADSDPAVRAICILGRGYWWFGNGAQWEHRAATDEYDEVISFVSGVINTLFGSAASRGSPRLGEYLMRG